MEEQDSDGPDVLLDISYKGEGGIYYYYTGMEEKSNLFNNLSAYLYRSTLSIVLLSIWPSYSNALACPGQEMMVIVHIVQFTSCSASKGVV